MLESFDYAIPRLYGSHGTPLVSQTSTVIVSHYSRKSTRGFVEANNLLLW